EGPQSECNCCPCGVRAAIYTQRWFFDRSWSRPRHGWLATTRLVRLRDIIPRTISLRFRCFTACSLRHQWCVAHLAPAKNTRTSTSKAARQRCTANSMGRTVW
ncbi:unnamed protein product, partial [Laminaria digitata]